MNLNSSTYVSATGTTAINSSSNIPIYQNFNSLSNTQQTSTFQSDDDNQSICEYYTPCEYCLQSISDNDFENHKVPFFQINSLLIESSCFDA